MTVTNEATTKALAILDRCNLNAAKSGQAAIWAQVINEAAPSANDGTLMEAVKKIAVTRTSDGRGGSWVTVGDLIAQVRAIRRVEIEAEERRNRQIESGSPVASIDVKRVMADARKGLSPEEIGRRARERAEGRAK